MSTTKTTTVTVLALAAALALTGCSSTPKATPTQAQSATATATQTATAPTSTPTPTLTAGVKVTNTGGTFIEDLQKTLAPGLHLIRLGDTLVYMVVDEHQPLPAEVLDPVVAQIKAGWPVPERGSSDALDTANELASDLEGAAGKCVFFYNGPALKGVYFVAPTGGNGPLGGAGWPLYKEYSRTFLANRPKTLDAAIAQFIPFANRAGCETDRLVFIQYTN